MKKLSKALLGVLMGTAALCSVAAFAACNSAPTHDWDDDFTVDIPATCTTDGSKSIHCKDCDETKDVTPIPAGHSWADDFTVDLLATCATDGSKSIHCNNCDETKDVTPIPAGHNWSKWVITDPTVTDPGSAMRTCSGTDCNATDEMKKFILPALSNSDYEVMEDTATCTEDGYVNYTYNHNGEIFSFDVPTKATGSHTVADWTTTKDPTCVDKGEKIGQCSVCHGEVKESIPATGKHTPTLPYNQCEVCQKQPQSSDKLVGGNSVTIDFTVNPGEWYTVSHMFMSAGYILYTYNGTTPVQIWYSTYGNGAVHSGNAVLNQGDSFYLPSSSRGTGYFAFKTTSDAPVTGSISGTYQSSAPIMPKAMEIGTQSVSAAVDSDDPSTLYEFIATEDGVNAYVLYCDDTDALILKKDSSDSSFVAAETPYAFTLAKGEKISFRMSLNDFISKSSYTVTLVMGEPHEHNWGEWTEKSPASCTAAKIEQRDCIDTNCPNNGHQEKAVGAPWGHDLTEVDAKVATCAEDGYEAYWSCSRCNKLFSDEYGQYVIANPVVTTVPHTYALTVVENEDGNGGNIGDVCSVCGHEKTSYNYDNKVDVVGGNPVPTVALSSGANLMDISRGAVTNQTAIHYASFTADKTGTYTFEFQYVNNLITQFNSVSVNDTKLANTDFTKVVSGRKILSITIHLNEGDECSLYLGAQLTAGLNKSYYLVTVGYSE